MDRFSSLLLGSICNLLVLLLQVTSVYAQDKYIVHHYTNENGLPAHGVKSIELDKRNGFLWIGTQAGLVRFDGKQFKSFGLATSRIAVISKSIQGSIYCEDDDFLIYEIENNKPRFVGIDSIFKAPLNAKWDNQAAKQLVEILKLRRNSPYLSDWAIFHDKKKDSDISFIYSWYKYGYYYNVANNKLYNFPGFDGILKVNRSVYFIRNNTELWKFNDSLKKLVPVEVRGMPLRFGKKDEKPYFIWKQSMDRPLLIYKQDLWQLNENGNALELSPLCKECCPLNADINSIQVWKEQGIFFFGSEVNGLYVARAPFTHSLPVSPSKETRTVEYAQAEIEPGIITTASGLVYSAEGDLLPGKATINFEYSNIFKDKQGNYWFSSKDTIIHYYPQTSHYIKITPQGDAIKTVFAETNNKVYVISDLTIAEVTNDQYRLLYKQPYATRTNRFNPGTAIEWQPGVLAIAADKLILFDVERGKTPLTVNIPGLTVKVRALLKYGNYLLIGTYGQGFYIYKNGVVKKMPPDKNNYLSYAHCFVPDGKGFCWISTNHGLFKASMKALIAAYEDNLNEIYYHYFGKGDGINNTELNGGCQPCALKTSSGLYSFPSMNGIVTFDPGGKHPPPPSGQIFIEEVLADSATYQPQDAALHKLAYSIKNLRFKLALPQFGNPENVYFSYKLEPYNEGWEVQDITQNNVLQFGGLKPGKYKLHLRIRNGFETDQFKITTISFRVLSPWYQTWWFYTLCITGFIAFVWGVVKWRTARIEKRRKELQQLVTKQTEGLTIQSTQLEHQLTQLTSQQTKLEQDNRIKSRLLSVISHDMLSPIKFISYLSKRMSDTIPESDENHRVARSMASVTHDMESLTVSLLNWIRFHYNSLEMSPERFNLYQLIKETTDIPSGMAREKGVTFVIEVQEKLEILQYKQALGIVIYNLATNAVKYTSNGEVRITGGNLDNAFFITITDTGKGMPNEMVERLNDAESFDFNYLTKENKRYQFGYVIIKDLVCMLNATMKVESILNMGTSVTIRLSNL